jgi:hypothetical protein
MSHVQDRLAEFVFEELTGPEMEAARQHVAQCLECQGRVAGFQKVQHSLEQLPDVEVPRRMVFVPSETPSIESIKAKTRWAPLRWAVPSTIAAALVLGLLLGGSFRFERNDSGFVLALGSVNEPPQTVEIESPFQAVDTEVPVVTTIDYASLDYAQIVNRVREDIRDEEEDWLRAEIDRVMGTVEAANVREIQRVRAELQYLSELQRVAQKDYLQNASSIQLLAQRTERE